VRILTKRVVFLILAVFLLSIAYASAESIIISHEDLRSRVSPGETAEFLFTIKNNMNSEATLLIGPNELDAHPFSTVIEKAEVDKATVVLKAKESVKVKLTLKIFEDAVPNINYKTFIIAKSATDPDIRARDDVTVSVLMPDDLVGITTTFPDKIIAGKDDSFNITFTSRVNKILKDVELSISSEFMQDSSKENIYYGVPITKQLEYGLDSSTKPGKYKLSVKVFYNGMLRGSLTKEFEVIKNPDIMENNQIEKGFLFKRYIFERENKGNIELEEKVFLPLGFFERIFATSNIKPNEKNDAGYEWTFALKPGEKRDIDAKTDYRTVFYGTIIILLFAFGLWYYLHKTILIKKYLFHVKDSDSGTSELKIMIKIKNKGDPLRIVRAVDIVPGFFKLLGEYGTLKPAQTENTYNGTRITWDVHNLEMGDERLISYKIESKTAIHATSTLPPAAVIYKKLSKRITKTSNRVVFVPKSLKKQK